MGDRYYPVHVVGTKMLPFDSDGSFQSGDSRIYNIIIMLA